MATPYSDHQKISSSNSKLCEPWLTQSQESCWGKKGLKVWNKRIRYSLLAQRHYSLKYALLWWWSQRKSLIVRIQIEEKTWFLRGVKIKKRETLLCKSDFYWKSNSKEMRAVTWCKKPRCCHWGFGLRVPPVKSKLQTFLVCQFYIWEIMNIFVQLIVYVLK